MRESFFRALEEVMRKDKKVVLFSADMGFKALDSIRNGYKDRFYNVGIAEQNMIGVAAGLAISGKIVYVYSIIPFVAMRCYEEIRVDVCAQNLNVKIVGLGAGMDYSTLGLTHHAYEDIAIMRVLPNMTILSPCDKYSMIKFADLSHGIRGPVYIRFERYEAAPVYTRMPVYTGREKFSSGFNIIRKSGEKIVIIATGRMVTKALEVEQLLLEQGIESSIVDFYRIKPINTKKLLEVASKSTHIITMEEHSIIGGLGGAIAQFLAEYNLSRPLKCFGLPDKFCQESGSRDYLYKQNGLDSPNLLKEINSFISN